MTELDDTIQTNAQGPKKATTDAGSVEQHGLKDQIEAAEHLAANTAARSRRRGITIQRLKPPGTI